MLNMALVARFSIFVLLMAECTAILRVEKVKDDRLADLHEIGRQNRYVLTISKKEKCLYIAARHDNDATLKLSRKELYAIGKMMNKRVKRGRKASV